MNQPGVVIAVLLGIGGVNWRLVGALGSDLGAMLFGTLSPLSRVTCALIGATAVYQALQWQAIHGRWPAPARAARVAAAITH